MLDFLSIFLTKMAYFGLWSKRGTWTNWNLRTQHGVGLVVQLEKWSDQCVSGQTQWKFSQNRTGTPNPCPGTWPKRYRLCTFGFEFKWAKHYLVSARFSSLVSDKWLEFEIMFDIWDADDFTAFQIDWAPIEALCSALLAADLVIFCNPYDLVC